MLVAYVTITALNDLTFQLNVARFVGTESFLIRYSHGHTKQTYDKLKKFRDF
jgi:hypothetical protein